MRAFVLTWTLGAAAAQFLVLVILIVDLRLATGSTVAELDLAKVTPTAIVENGTISNSSLSKQTANQTLSSLLDSIRTSVLVDENVEVLAPGTKDSLQKADIPDLKNPLKPLPTKARPVKNGTLGSVPREMSLSTVMNVLDVSMYKDPSFTRSAQASHSAAQSASFWVLCMMGASILAVY